MTVFSVKGWLEVSLLDWPSKVASVVFLPGCNFRCPYCHNHTLVLEPDTLEDIPLDRVIAAARARAGWIDGIVVTGGEPTIQPQLPNLLSMIKQGGFPVKLDTNGSRPEVLGRIIEAGLVDHVAIDLKAPLRDEPYRILSGVAVDTDLVRRSVELILSSGLPHTFRTTVVPGLTTDEDLMELAGEIKGSGNIVLQGFNPPDALDPAWRRMKAPTEEELARLRRLVDRSRTGRPIASSS